MRSIKTNASILRNVSLNLDIGKAKTAHLVIFNSDLSGFTYPIFAYSGTPHIHFKCYCSFTLIRNIEQMHWPIESIMKHKHLCIM